MDNDQKQEEVQTNNDFNKQKRRDYDSLFAKMLKISDKEVEDNAESRKN